MKVVDGTTVDDAVNIMQEAHVNGMALVTQCSQVGPCVGGRGVREGRRGALDGEDTAAGSVGAPLHVAAIGESSATSGSAGS